MAAWVTHPLVSSLSEYKGVCADIWTFEALRKWKQSQNNGDLWKDANVRWMGRKWEKRQEGFNEKTINFRDVLSTVCRPPSEYFPEFIFIGWKAQRGKNEPLSCKLLSNSYMSFFGVSPHFPPSCSNSVTSLLPNSYPPWWFPMGLHLIQLSEHTHTICFEVFFFSTADTTAQQLH